MATPDPPRSQPRPIARTSSGEPIRCGVCSAPLTPDEQMDAPWSRHRGYMHEECWEYLRTL